MNEQPRQNKTDAGNGSYGICRVIDASRSQSHDPKRSASPAASDAILLCQSESFAIRSLL
jgi:hypothetical protein